MLPVGYSKCMLLDKSLNLTHVFCIQYYMRRKPQCLEDTFHSLDLWSTAHYHLMGLAGLNKLLQEHTES